MMMRSAGSIRTIGRPYPKPANGVGPECCESVSETGRGAVEYMYRKILSAFERGIPPPRSLNSRTMALE